MYEIVGNKISLTRGDSFYAQVSIKRKGTGQDYDIQPGDTVRFYLKRALMNQSGSAYADHKPLITKVVPTDTLVLHLEPEDTKPFAFGDYEYDLELTFANGDVDTFINHAPFELVKEVG